MTKRELEQIRHLPREKAMLERELERLPVVCDTVTGSRKGIPYDTHVIRIEGVDRKKEARLRKKIAVIERQQERLECWIDSVEDSEIRQILTLRFREGQSWQKVAFGIGHHDEQYPRRKFEKFISDDENDEK